MLGFSGTPGIELGLSSRSYIPTTNGVIEVEGDSNSGTEIRNDNTMEHTTR